MAGERIWTDGYFTMLKYIATEDALELERRLGFHSGRLQYGYDVAVLADGELLTADDFTLMASSRWSGGAIRLKSMPGTDVRDLLAQRESDERLRSQVASFLALRHGNTPAKVLPVWRHRDWMEYPDGKFEGRRGGVPQFKLTRKKCFVVVRREGPNFGIN